jgi:peptidoglycan/LPS O-acetylase OafA/YrhL
MGIQFNGKWIEELDYLRGMAVIAIIVQHLSGSYYLAENLSYFDIAALYSGTTASFAVPLFCVVSGLVLAHNYDKIDEIGSFYIKRAKSILPQFLIFSALYVALMFFNGHRLTLSQVIFRILTGSSAVHLWFIVAITQFYLFFPFGLAAYNYLELRNRSESALVLCMLIQIIWLSAISSLNRISLGLSPDQIWIISHTLTRVFLSCLFYFALGVYLRRSPWGCEKILYALKNRYVLLLGFTFSLVLFLSRLSEFERFAWVRPSIPDFMISTVIGPAFNILAFILCYRIAKKLMREKRAPGNLIEAFGIFSMGIYLIHLLFIDLLQHSLSLLHIGTDTWSFYPLLFVGTCLLSFITIKLLSRLPHSEFIIGFSPTMRLAQRQAVMVK